MDPERRERLERTKRWEPAEAEAGVFQRWEASGVFHPSAESDRERFSVAIPPPNVTGSLHMGHALNSAIQDAIVRTKRMQGYETLWILGTDHAGIATQSVVEKRLAEEGVDRHELGREAFVERVWQWKSQYADRIVEQLRRLGASCDYERERFTLDDGYVAAVHRVFVALYEKGYVYRDNYIVNWDVGSRSAISDLEVENREVEDTLYSIDYPVEGSDRALTVATVRPETMLADTAVAVHPDDERYRDVVGGHCVLPLVGRRLPIIADPYVDPDFGTGALKITPGHDPNDFDIGRSHGLEEISAIAEDGTMSEAAGAEYRGMTADEARAAVVAALREHGALRSEEPYTHSVPFSHRSGQRIEPLISLQWFCRMDELAGPAIDVVERDEVRIVPEQWKRVYLDWMRGIRPWCISRQLWWGHRLPVWYGPGGEVVVAETEEAARSRARELGLDAEALERDPDVLDTWFSSALWPFATLGWPEATPELEAFYPTSFLTTARDILYLWVARMIMCGIEFAGEAPFRDVYVHSVIQARDGRRMSKSLGTGIDPLDEIEVHGADALRFGLLAMSSSQDVRYSDDRVQQGRDLANKLWNASRLILLNAREVEPAPGRDAVEDRWIASRLTRVTEEVTALIEAYELSRAALAVYHFIFDELCDWYLEIVKPRLYAGEEAAAASLRWVLARTLALAHPVIPFVTEEIHGYVDEGNGVLAGARYPVADDTLIDEGAEARMRGWIELVKALRRWRDMVGLEPRELLAARARGEVHEMVPRLARLELGEERGEAVGSLGPIELLASDALARERVEERVGARRRELEAEVARCEGKLANERFVSRAPADVVEAERSKLASYRAELDELG